MAIRGTKKKDLTIDTILNEISEYDIYKYYMPNEWDINEVTNSPFSIDRSPSFVIGNKYGRLTHKAFNDAEKKGDCFSFVQQLFNLHGLKEALLKIDEDFNLGISHEKLKEFTPIKWEMPKEAIIKPPPVIQITTRKPNKEELKYWAQYGLELEDLKKENIYFPKTVYRNKQKLPNKILTFAYLYPEISKIKLYRPLAPKRIKGTPSWLWKWDSNVPFDYCDNLNAIKECKYAFLSKSKKDRMVLQKVLGITCMADVQAEDPSCISEETLQHYKDNSEYQVTIFDSDEKGKSSSLMLSDMWGFKHCNVPDKYLEEGINDFADLFKKYGEKSIIEHFKEKGYVN